MSGQGTEVVSAELGVTHLAREHVRERSLTFLLACLLLLIFVVTPLVEQRTIGLFPASVLWSLPGILALLVVSWHPAAFVVIRVEGLAIPAPSGPSEWVTVSVGAAAAVPERDVGPETLLALADQLLYSAKSAGKNRIAVAEESAEAPPS